MKLFPNFTHHHLITTQAYSLIHFFAITAFCLNLDSGPSVTEQAKPTEEMNGVLHDEELPPQVIKRFAKVIFWCECL